MAELRAFMSNKDLENGFYIREVGVFAEDPDTGKKFYTGMAIPVRNAIICPNTAVRML